MPHQTIQVRLEYYTLDKDGLIIEKFKRSFFGVNTNDLKIWLNRYFLLDAKKLLNETYEMNFDYRFHCIADITIDKIVNCNVERSMSLNVYLDDFYDFERIVTAANTLQYVINSQY